MSCDVGVFRCLFRSNAFRQQNGGVSAYRVLSLGKGRLMGRVVQKQEGAPGKGGSQNPTFLGSSSSSFKAEIPAGFPRGELCGGCSLCSEPSMQYPPGPKVLSSSCSETTLAAAVKPGTQ